MSSPELAGPEVDEPQVIGHLTTGHGGAKETLAVGWHRGDVLLGHPRGWPVRLTEAQYSELLRLLNRADSKRRAWHDRRKAVR